MIEKFLSNTMVLKSVKTTFNNTLIVEIAKRSYVELLLRTTTLHNLKIKAYPHRFLSTPTGVVKCLELTVCTLEEIKNKLKDQKVSMKRTSIKTK